MKATIAALAAAVALAFAAAPATAADKDCSDFSSWRQAQKFYKKHGGPKYDPHRLDADHDGIACEDLR
jgi:Spy/CpxP family protein refolding chaperone